MNSSRLIRIVGSFALVVVAYVAYELLAVPLIEPPKAAPQAAHQRIDAPAVTSPLQTLLAQHFAPGSWQLDKPKIIQTKQAVLLLQEYQAVEGGQMQLTPCTVLFFPEESDSTGEAHQRSMILDAPAGAVLQFDEELDLARGEFGDLLGGRLVGDITITASESAPGVGDDFWLKTHNVQMDRQRVWTPHEVSFRYGPHHGSGRDLIITMLPPGTTGNIDSSVGEGGIAGGLQSLELVHVDRLHIDGGAAMFAADGSAEDNTIEGDEAGSTPVDVTCRGPFLLDLVAQIASFEDNVDVLHTVEDGQSDQLNCRRLEIHFDRGLSTTPETADSSSALAVSKVVALGHPVQMKSPTYNASARGQRLEYTVATRRILLESTGEVSLSHDQREIHAQRLEYEMADEGRLGRIWAAGPGKFSGKVRPSDEQTITAAWAEELQLRPDGDNQLLSLTGGAHVGFADVGGVSAKEIHFWMFESTAQANPAAGGEASAPRIQPDRILAVGQVEINSPQLVGKSQRMELWFDNQPGPLDTAAESTASDSPLMSRMATPAGQPNTQQYQVEGDLVRVLLARQGDSYTVADTNMEGSVLLRQIETVPQRNVTMEITGDVLDVRGANSPATTISVTGKPSRISGRGSTLVGRSIQLDRAANRGWIEGAGKLTFPMQPGQDRMPTNRPTPVHVAWNEGMQFDGRVVQLNGGVLVHTDTQRLTGPAMTITLSRHVDFTSPGDRDNLDVQQIEIPGQVTLDNRTITEGKQTSVDRMMVRNLKINQATGDITADGPGWVRSVRLGSMQPTGQLAARPVTHRDEEPTRVPPPSDGEELSFLLVTFQRGLIGNITQRELNFHQQVKATYGPVQRWDEAIDVEATAGPQEGVVVLNCDKLTAAEVGQEIEGRAPLEMTAIGNTLVEGQTFTARAHRLSYAHAKELLVMEGDGRNDAELFRQAEVGGPTARAAARKILYWRKTGRVDVDNANFLDWAGPLPEQGEERRLPDGVRNFLGDGQRKPRDYSSTAPP